VEQLVRMLVGPTTDPKDKAIEDKQISHAVRTTMLETTTSELRCLSGVHQALAIDGLALGLRLEKWLRGNPLGWVFDNPFDAQDLTTHRLYGYDYTEFLSERELCGPVMAYLMHLADSMIDGRPFVYYVTEFWQAMSDPYFTEYVRNKQKTIRKESGLGVFDTQQPDDVLTEEIGKTMVQQCVTKIYLPNPDADRADYVDGFKLTESEFKLLRSFTADSRLMLIKQGHRSTVARFDLGGMTEVLTVLSGSLDNVHLMDSIRAEVGDDPDVCFPILHQRVAERRARIRAKRA
ncbi:MAG TPA: VirB4 family type IV secretion/conjugal transfer ATPase, partial [Mycobacterium sp.]